jgi:hypothetical protein
MFVELTDSGPKVREAENLRSLSVRAATSQALAGIGELGEVDPDGEHVWLHLNLFKAAAAATIDAAARDEWSAGFDRMIAYAADHGWTKESGTKVRAHREAPPLRA